MNRFTALALMLAIVGSAGAQGRPSLVVGTVVDRTTGLRLAGVAVSAAGAADGASTDDEGIFALQVSPGHVTIGLSRTGYVAGGVDTTTAGGDTLRIHFTMITTGTRSVQSLAAVAVTEKVGGLPGPFERRREVKGGGRFYVTEDITKLNPPHVPGLLQRITGGMIVFSGASMVLVSKRGTTSMATENGDACPYAVVLNELTMPVDFDLRSIQPENLVGVEVYNGASSIPVELNGTRGGEPTCGLVVLWTKGGR
jgi:hypothetical protein